MRTVPTVARMQRLALRWREARVRVGLVPTMGYLHEGHISLVRRARQAAGRSGIVVVSIYVNPMQFSPAEDLSSYPRDLQRDLTLCREAGVDIVFLPSDADMYPRGAKARFSTHVTEGDLSSAMEGVARPAHFRGVTTVVAKLFNIVLPDVAVFGAKDFQQAAIIQRMVRDLNFPLKIVVAPTVREPDGLAMSSRNKYLDGGLRAEAVVLWRAIQRAQTSVSEKRTVSASVLRRELTMFIEEQPHARVDYIAFFDPETLQPMPRVVQGTQMALAVFVGKTRLIDNARI